MWEIVLLAFIIVLALVVWIVFGGGGARRFSVEVSRLRAELERMRSLNEALRSSLAATEMERGKRVEELCDFICDLERVKSSLAGCRPSQEALMKKYGIQPSPELIDAIFEKSPMVDADTKRGVSHELLVGEIGKAVLEGLAGGKGVSEIAATAGLPVIVVRSQLKGLQVLGYVNRRLALTERGRAALSSSL